MDPFVEGERCQLRPLPPTAEVILRQHHAPPRLIAHLILVHDVASRLLDAFQMHDLAYAVNYQDVLFGAATHDIGKVTHKDELSSPGHQHEYAGKMLLLQGGVSLEMARFAETHGQWAAAGNSIDDLLVALADTCWKGKCDHELEQQIAIERASDSGHERWTVFLLVDDIVEQIAVTANHRLAWQALFPIDVQ
jgi:hypothetical protein